MKTKDQYIDNVNVGPLGQFYKYILTEVGGSQTMIGIDKNDFFKYDVATISKNRVKYRWEVEKSDEDRYAGIMGFLNSAGTAEFLLTLEYKDGINKGKVE
jgi:hypothetical protein